MSCCIRLLLPGFCDYCVSLAMSPEVARCVVASDNSFLMRAAIVFLWPCSLRWLDVLLYQTSPSCCLRLLFFSGHVAYGGSVSCCIRRLLPTICCYCVSQAMSPELVRCLVASDDSLLIPAAIVFLGPCRLRWLGVLLHQTSPSSCLRLLCFTGHVACGGSVSCCIRHLLPEVCCYCVSQAMSPELIGVLLHQRSPS